MLNSIIYRTNVGGRFAGAQHRGTRPYPKEGHSYMQGRMKILLPGLWTIGLGPVKLYAENSQTSGPLHRRSSRPKRYKPLARR